MDISGDMLDEISSDTHSSDMSAGSNHSTESTSPRKTTFFFDENSSQDSGVGFDRDSRDAKDLVSMEMACTIIMLKLLTEFKHK